MSSSQFTYPARPTTASHLVREEQIEYGFIGKLQGLKYEYRDDIRDRAALERNFRDKFEALNRVKLSDGELARLLDEIVTPDVFTAAKTLRNINTFTREDGTPLNYTLVNINDWCKNTFEVVNQLRINTDYSHHRYDVLILINGVPCVQIELKTADRKRDGLCVRVRFAAAECPQKDQRSGRHYWQDLWSRKNITTYNLARMNMLLHGVNDIEFDIFDGYTLANDWDLLRELNPAKNLRSTRFWLTRHSATAGTPRTRWRMMCGLKTTAWRPSRRLTLRFCCTAFTF